MIVLITGGAKNGKSGYAQNLAVKLASGAPHYYLATMIPSDNEDQARIRRHVADRAGLGFETLECGRNLLESTANADPKGTFLLDSTTALLMNELFPDPTGGNMDEDAPRRCREAIVALAARVKHLVIVSDYIYADPIRYDPVTEFYRAGLAGIDRAVAQIADTVLEFTVGIPIVHKGVLPL